MIVLVTLSMVWGGVIYNFPFLYFSFPPCGLSFRGGFAMSGTGHGGVVILKSV